jgi:hypothetical protein
MNLVSDSQLDEKEKLSDTSAADYNSQYAHRAGGEISLSDKSSSEALTSYSSRPLFDFQKLPQSLVT